MPDVALQVWFERTVIALLMVCVLPSLLVMPPARTIKPLPPSVKAPALLLKISDAISQLTSTFGVSRLFPARMTVAVPSFAGTPPDQFAAVLQLLFAPLPVQTNVAACAP